MCYAVLCCAVLCCSVLFCAGAALRSAVLRCAVLCCVCCAAESVVYHSLPHQPSKAAPVPSRAALSLLFRAAAAVQQCAMPRVHWPRLSKTTEADE
jgi:hypothetical protein